MVLADASVFRRKKWHFLILDVSGYLSVNCFRVCVPGRLRFLAGVVNIAGSALHQKLPVATLADALDVFVEEEASSHWYPVAKQPDGICSALYASDAPMLTSSIVRSCAGTLELDALPHATPLPLASGIQALVL